MPYLVYLSHTKNDIVMTYTYIVVVIFSTTIFSAALDNLGARISYYITKLHKIHYNSLQTAQHST